MAVYLKVIAPVWSQHERLIFSDSIQLLRGLWYQARSQDFSREVRSNEETDQINDAQSANPWGEEG